MNVRRVLPALAVLLAIPATGCHVGGAGNLIKPDPPLPRTSLEAMPAIEAHNRNAERITSLKASPRIDVTAGGSSHSVSGLLAMERPRNFKLEMRAPVGGNVADIGSNDEEFWFWVKDKKDNAIRFCRHDEIGSSALASTFEPEWVMEALGLRLIPKSESSTLASSKGPRPNTYLLTQRRRGGRNETMIKETVIDDSGRILEHRLYGPDRQMMARATVSKFRPLSLDDPNGSGTVINAWLPEQVKLEWFQERMSLDISLNKIVANPAFTESIRASLFVEPSLAGVQRIDLAREGMRAGAQAEPRQPRGIGSLRSTRPAPPSGNGIQLGDPMPLEAEGARRGSGEPVALAADLRDTPVVPASRETVVGAPLPQPAGNGDTLPPLPPGSARFRSSTLDR